MLRHDSCWPYSEGHDSSKLEHHERGRRRVVLQTISEHAPTIGRWNSFNWAVVDAKGECRGERAGIAGLAAEGARR